MLSIRVKDFVEWRIEARGLLARNVKPEQISWSEDISLQTNLFSFEDDRQIVPLCDVAPVLTIPRSFITLAQHVACHRSSAKWSMLYLALWRLTHGEKHLLQMSTDGLVYELLRMQKAVTRDLHKMKAFVRFKQYKKASQEFYLAWYQPDHKILQLACPFFQNRFRIMQWLIVTPDGAAYWNGEQLQLDERITALKAPLVDEMDDLWRTYYRAIFNPARIKLKAMRKEMPIRYWQNLPETSIIKDLLLQAPQRVDQMLKHNQQASRSAADYLPAERSLAQLRLATSSCQGCKLYTCAKQTVFGVGPATAKLMLVGEQPGEQEDSSGQPFCGPAGQLLNELLDKAGIKREEVYLSNAVKHFKHTHRTGKRIHVTPNIHEITACRPWLLAEIEAIQPKVIICLGLTAARALINPGFHMKEQRGKWLKFSATIHIMASYHPSAILRAIAQAQQKAIYNQLLADLKSGLACSL